MFLCSFAHVLLFPRQTLSSLAKRLFTEERKHFASERNVFRNAKQKPWQIYFSPVSYFFPLPCPFRGSVVLHVHWTALWISVKVHVFSNCVKTQKIFTVKKERTLPEQTIMSVFTVEGFFLCVLLSFFLLSNK